MVDFVRCGKNASTLIRLPEGVTAVVGQTMECPSSCRGCFGKTGTFKVGAILKKDEETAKKMRCFQYEQKSSNGTTNNINTNNLAERSIVQTVQKNVQKIDLEQTPAPKVNIVAEPSLKEPTSNNSTINKYDRFGGGNRSKSESNMVVKEYLQPVSSYTEINVGGRRYSNDPEVKKNNWGILGLNECIKDIFTTWNTNEVFTTAQGKELQDRFIWLLCTVSKKNIECKKVEDILSNQDYSLSQKFFYLFYDIVYEYNQPTGFYWFECNERTRMSLNSIVAKFRNKEDFVAKYCSNDTQKALAFQTFYKTHKKEILHFLGCESEIGLFEDMTLMMAKHNNKIVLVDSSNNYTPICLGSIKEFVQKMQQPSSLSVMNNMVAFLEKYYISRNYIVSRRSAIDSFEKSCRGNLVEDDSIYEAMHLYSSAMYASEYDAFVSLLKEYIKVFKPLSIMLGDVCFTKMNYSAELRENAFSYCKALYGYVDDQTLKERKGKAWLSKSLYERKILDGFNCENSESIQQVLNMVSSSVDYEKFYKVFQEPCFTISGQDVTMEQYIGKIIDSNDEITAANQLKNDKKVASYFNYKINGNEAIDRLNDCLNNNQKLYSQFANKGE